MMQDECGRSLLHDFELGINEFIVFIKFHLEGLHHGRDLLLLIVLPDTV